MKFTDFIVEINGQPESQGDSPLLKKAVERPDRFTTTPDTALNKAGTKPQAHKIVKQNPDGAFEIKQNRGHPEWTPDGFESTGPINKVEFPWNESSSILDRHGQYTDDLNHLRKTSREKYDADPMNSWSHGILGTYADRGPEFLGGDRKNILNVTPENYHAFDEDEFHVVPGKFETWEDVSNNEEEYEEYMREKFVRKRTDDDDKMQDGLDKLSEYVHKGSGPINNFLRYGGYKEPPLRSSYPPEPDEPSWKKLSRFDDLQGSSSELIDFNDEDMKSSINSMLHAMRQQQETLKEDPKFYQRMLEDKNDLFNNLKEGDIISDPGFMSTASSEKRPDWKWSGNTKMNIFGGKGRFNMPAWFSKYLEGETLFEPGTRLRFRGMKDDEYMFDQEGFNRDDFEELGSELEEQAQPKSEDRKFGDMHFIIQKEPFKKYNDFKQQLDHDD